jgi:hypothetical protein
MQTRTIASLPRLILNSLAVGQKTMECGGSEVLHEGLTPGEERANVVNIDWGQSTTYRGPRTDAAGLTGTTWPVTSQSNRWRIGASRCLTLGAASSRVPASIQVATCTGCTAPIDGTPALAHQAPGIRQRRGRRPGACAGCGCWRRRIRESACRRGRRRPRRSPARLASPVGETDPASFHYVLNRGPTNFFNRVDHGIKPNGDRISIGTHPSHRSFPFLRVFR